MITKTTKETPDYTMDFSMALCYMKCGARCFRKGWNGEGMYVYLIPGHTLNDGTEVSGFFCLSKPDGNLVYGWVPSQEDLLSDDWKIVDGGFGIKMMTPFCPQKEFPQPYTKLSQE